MEFFIRGGGWVTAGGYGRMKNGHAPELGPGEPVLPKSSEIFDQPLSRYGRFDRYTKMGCAAVALALKDVSLNAVHPDRPAVGLVCSSISDCLETDLAYYRTTLEEDGQFASPNLFSYTLPGIMVGECSVHFKLTGPTFCLGESDGRGMTALQCALRILEAGKTSAMLAGSVESPPAGLAEEMKDYGEIYSGAFFVAIRAQPADDEVRQHRLIYRNGRILTGNEKPVSSILDLFDPEFKGH